MKFSLQHQTTDLVSRFDKLSEPLSLIHRTVYGGQGVQPHNFQVRITTIPEHWHHLSCLFIQTYLKVFLVNVLLQWILQCSGSLLPTSCRLGEVLSGGELLEFMQAYFRSWLDCFVFSLCFRSRGWMGSLWIPLDTAACHWGAIRGSLTTLHVSAGSCQDVSVFTVVPGPRLTRLLQMLVLVINMCLYSKCASVCHTSQPSSPLIQYTIKLLFSTTSSQSFTLGAS